MKRFHIIFLVSIAVLTACSRSPRIALLTGDSGLSQQDLFEVLSEEVRADIDLVPITPALNLRGYDLVWYHRPDTSSITADERAAGKALADFVRWGGATYLEHGRGTSLLGMGFGKRPCAGLGLRGRR